MSITVQNTNWITRWWRWSAPLIAIALLVLVSVELQAQSLEENMQKQDSVAMVAPAAVNINSASAEQLALALSGIGSAKAAEIVAYRAEHGAFSSVEELLNIKGIGRKTLERNRYRLVVE